MLKRAVGFVLTVLLTDVFSVFRCLPFYARTNNKNEYIMKGLIKNSGLLLVLIGAIILMVCAFTGNVNNNALLGVSTALVVVGLIVYIVVNKYVQD